MNEPLPVEALRWRCDPKTLPFQSTEEVEPIPGVVGQESAVDSLRFGLECHAPGQNVFVRGLTGTGRMTLVRRLLEELRPTCATKYDRCYVHDFAEPDRPRLITLPAGRARAFRRVIHRIAEFIRDDLDNALKADAVKARRESLERRAETELTEITAPFEQDLRDAGLALVTVQLGPVTQTAIFPVVDGKPLPPEEYEQLRAEGKVSEADYEAFRARRETFQKRLEETTHELREIRGRHARAIHSIIEETARGILGDMARVVLIEFPGEDVRTFLSEVVDDVAETRLGGPLEGDDPVALYGVNILIEHEDDAACPIVVENAPTLSNLLGTIDREWGPKGPGRSDYRMIRPGSLLRADGGYLILDAREALTEPGAWRVLLRTLKTGRLEIAPSELSFFALAPSLKPEAIPVNVKVILLGDTTIYYLLDRHEPDFTDLFKVLADFDTVIPREGGVPQYASVLARLVDEEGLPHFDKTAVAALAEHGARIAGRPGKLTALFGRVADIAREAAFLTGKESGAQVTAQNVRDAVSRTKARAALPSRRFRELLADGTIQVQLEGSVVGQINGLAVIAAGPVIYGFPARITASIGAGSAGIINIEGQAQLSGAIHTKGFHILGGLLRHLLQTDHPLAFSASVAFEQSYGGIDGDSASGAEACCLLSALTGVAIRQDIAITGAIDQVGHIQAIGGVNEKIEGFFDTCRDVGLTGTQGVVIPRSNAGELMLRPDVVEACAEGRFAIYSVATVQEALEVLTGQPAGERGENGEYPEGTLLCDAVLKAREYWRKSFHRPTLQTGDDEEEAPAPS